MSLWEIKYRIRRFREATERKIAWMLPKRIVMWAFMRVMAHSTTGEYGGTLVNRLTGMDAIKRWSDDNGI